MAGWIGAGVVAVALVSAGAASAATPSSPPHQAAVDVYVEEFPTASGAVPADVAGIGAGNALRTAGTARGGNGGLIWLGLVLVGVTAVIVVVRARSGADRGDA
jgi:hypothetical protein